MIIPLPCEVVLIWYRDEACATLKTFDLKIINLIGNLPKVNIVLCEVSDQF